MPNVDNLVLGTGVEIFLNINTISKLFYVFYVRTLYISLANRRPLKWSKTLYRKKSLTL